MVTNTGSRRGQKLHSWAVGVLVYLALQPLCLLSHHINSKEGKSLWEATGILEDISNRSCGVCRGDGILSQVP